MATPALASGRERARGARRRLPAGCLLRRPDEGPASGEYDAARAGGSRFAIANAEVAPKALSTSGHARRFRSRVEAAIWGPTARPALEIPRTQQPGQRQARRLLRGGAAVRAFAGDRLRAHRASGLVATTVSPRCTSSVGCHSDAYEQAKWFGDDLSSKSDAHYATDWGRVGPATSFMVKHIGGAGRRLPERARVGLAFVGAGRQAMMAMAVNQVYVCRDVSDSNVILSFGLFDGSLDELREIQNSAGGERVRTEPMAGLVEAVLLDGSYEVIERITP